MRNEHLERAKEELRLAAEEEKCGWCKKKTVQIAQALEDLETAMPDAERLRQAVSKTKELSNLDKLSAELKDQRGRSGRLVERLESFNREVATEPLPAPRPRPPPPAPRPLGPSIVTPDDIARSDAEAYQRYKQVARHRGPVRDRIAFRVFKRTEGN